MADLRISAMPVAADLGSSVVPVVQAGVNKQAPVSLFAALNNYAVESVSSTAALAVEGITWLSSSAPLNVLLNAGVPGKLKIIAVEAALDPITVAVPLGLGFTSIVFPNAGASAVLTFGNGKWTVLSLHQAILT